MGGEEGQSGGSEDEKVGQGWEAVVLIEPGNGGARRQTEDRPQSDILRRGQEPPPSTRSARVPYRDTVEQEGADKGRIHTQEDRPREAKAPKTVYAVGVRGEFPVQLLRVVVASEIIPEHNTKAPDRGARGHAHAIQEDIGLRSASPVPPPAEPEEFTFVSIE